MVEPEQAFEEILKRRAEPRLRDTLASVSRRGTKAKKGKQPKVAKPKALVDRSQRGKLAGKNVKTELEILKKQVKDFVVKEYGKKSQDVLESTVLGSIDTGRDVYSINEMLNDKPVKDYEAKRKWLTGFAPTKEGVEAMRAKLYKMMDEVNQLKAALPTIANDKIEKLSRDVGAKLASLKAEAIAKLGEKGGEDFLNESMVRKVARIVARAGKASLFSAGGILKEVAGVATHPDILPYVVQGLTALAEGQLSTQGLVGEHKATLISLIGPLLTGAAAVASGAGAIGMVPFILGGGRALYKLYEMWRDKKSAEAVSLDRSGKQTKAEVMSAIGASEAAQQLQYEAALEYNKGLQAGLSNVTMRGVDYPLSTWAQYGPNWPEIGPDPGYGPSVYAKNRYNTQDFAGKTLHEEKIIDVQLPSEDMQAETRRLESQLESPSMLASPFMTIANKVHGALLFSSGALGSVVDTLTFNTKPADESLGTSKNMAAMQAGWEAFAYGDHGTRYQGRAPYKITATRGLKDYWIDQGGQYGPSGAKIAGLRRQAIEMAELGNT